jgi:hypothetical protein
MTTAEGRRENESPIGETSYVVRGLIPSGIGFWPLLVIRASPFVI